MRYGFAIDQRTCIGCHACTVACKTEHEVPVGQFRTWVKYVEKGTYPDTTREFGVMRCNHCTDAPCVAICPTKSLFKRDDGIVDFDGDRCIGCKSCLQACPYDAIYLDEDTHTAAKCNFCAHRVDEGLEPACVVVCPTHSIWVGDLDDASSGISRLVNSQPVTVRAPEQNTGPNVFYLGADRAVLDPLAAPVDKTYLWSTPDAQRLSMAGEMECDAVTRARTTLNTPHPRPWGWRVSTYLWTKSVGAGTLAIAALARLLGADLGTLGDLVAPALAVLLLAVTGVLLVADLKRPERFLYLFTKPNPTSWLFWGSVSLAAYSAVAGLWLLLGIAGAVTDFDPGAGMTVLAWLAIPTAALTAAYTGFLFGQAEGRDLWQSPLLGWHLLVQAALAGAGGLLVTAPALDPTTSVRSDLARVLLFAALAHLLVMLLEHALRQPTRQAAAAARLLTHGRYARLFWLGCAGGTAVVGALAATGWHGGNIGLLAAAGLLAQATLIAYESVFVRAGQDLPLS